MALAILYQRQYFCFSNLAVILHCCYQKEGRTFSCFFVATFETLWRNIFLRGVSFMKSAGFWLCFFLFLFRVLRKRRRELLTLLMSPSLFAAPVHICGKIKNFKSPHNFLVSDLVLFQLRSRARWRSRHARRDPCHPPTSPATHHRGRERRHLRSRARPRRRTDCASTSRPTSCIHYMQAAGGQPPARPSTARASRSEISAA